MNCMGPVIFTYGVLLVQQLAAVATLAAVPIGRPGSESARPLLAVVTWNMDAGRGDLARLMADLESGALSGSRPEHFVVLLQEALEPAPATALPCRSCSSLFLAVRENDGRMQGNAIISSLKLGDRLAIPLPSARQVRNALAGTIVLDGPQLFVASAHLENRAAWWKSLFSDIGRGRQADALVRALPAGPGILGGDLNTWLGRQERAWQVLSRRFGDTPEFAKTATFRERLVLDHLLFDVPEGWEASSAVVADTYGSDHHPVLGLVFAASGSSRAGAR